MALTRPFIETIRERAAIDAKFRHGLLAGAVEELISGEVGVAKILLRDCIDVTVGFDAMAGEIGMSAPALKRVLQPKGGAHLATLLSIIDRLQRAAGLHLTVAAEPTKARAAAE